MFNRVKMFNLRHRIASGSLHHLLKKRETRMVVAPPPFSSYACVAENANREITTPAFEITSPAVAEKSCVFGKLEPFITREEEEKKSVNLTKEDLVDCAKRLNKDGKFEYAFEIFEWMDKKKKVEFSPCELAVYVDLICQTKGIDVAKEYFNKVEPVFDRTNTRAKNWPAFASIVVRVYEYERKNCQFAERPRRVRRIRKNI